MGFWQSIKHILTPKSARYSQMMSGYTPIFTQFGQDVYASDIVQGCIRRIASEIGKLQPHHIRTDGKGIQTIVNGDLERLLKYGPNPLMTTTDFLEKCVFLRETTKNCYIYPAYNIIPLGGGKYKRQYTGLYPIAPQTTEFWEDAKGRLIIKFIFANGENYSLYYSDIIHWRKDYGANDFCGGDKNGQPNNTAQLNLLQTSHTIVESLEKIAKTALNIQGVLKVNTMLDEDNLAKEREAFERKIAAGKSGILAIDLKNDYVPLTINPKMVDKDTISFIDNRLLANYGLSVPIYNSDFNEEQYQAFYESTLEPLVISLGRAFSRILFTQRELDIGNEIIFYQRGLMFTSTANKIKVADILSRIGGLTDNQVLELFGYEPFEGGDTRHMSLNYINRDIADKYQLSKITPQKLDEIMLEDDLQEGDKNADKK